MSHLSEPVHDGAAMPRVTVYGDSSDAARAVLTAVHEAQRVLIAALNTSARVAQTAPAFPALADATERLRQALDEVNALARIPYSPQTRKSVALFERNKRAAARGVAAIQAQIEALLARPDIPLQVRYFMANAINGAGKARAQIRESGCPYMSELRDIFAQADEVSNELARLTGEARALARSTSAHQRSTSALINTRRLSQCLLLVTPSNGPNVRISRVSHAQSRLMHSNDAHLRQQQQRRKPTSTKRLCAREGIEAPS